MRPALLLLNILLLALAMLAEFSTVAATGEFSVAPILWLVPTAMTVLAIYYPGQVLWHLGLAFNVLLGFFGLVFALSGFMGALSPAGKFDGWQAFVGVVFITVALVNFEATRTLGAPKKEEVDATST